MRVLAWTLAVACLGQVRSGDCPVPGKFRVSYPMHTFGGQIAMPGDCVQCQPGQYRGAGDADPSQCKACPDGRYMPHSGAVACDACPTGQTTLGSDRKDKCVAGEPTAQHFNPNLGGGGGFENSDPPTHDHSADDLAALAAMGLGGGEPMNVHDQWAMAELDQAHPATVAAQALAVPSAEDAIALP